MLRLSAVIVILMIATMKYSYCHQAFKDPDENDGDSIDHASSDTGARDGDGNGQETTEESTNE